MMPISEAAEQAVQNRSTKNSATSTSEQGSPDARSLKVWAVLAGMYGNALFREHGEQPSREWQAAVDRLSDEQLRQAFGHLARLQLQAAEQNRPAGGFPPNVVQFLAAARMKDPVRYLGTDRYRPPELPDKSPEAVMRGIKARIDMFTKLGRHQRVDELKAELAEMEAAT